MSRREFITLLGGTALAWPIGTRAQQPDRVRRVGVLMSQSSETDTGQAALAAFLQGLQQLGWTVGRNLQIDVRWAVGDPNLYRRHAAEIVSLHTLPRGRARLATSPAPTGSMASTNTIGIVRLDCRKAPTAA